MPLNVGSRIAHYDVTALIGEGGMGQVYQATDTKLNRQVALKILPEAFAADPDRLARFQREAQVLASLNHPNIAQIHGIEEDEGTRALVLELVEGPTLADRISQGPIPVDEALPIAKQIAEALEAAHEARVIHRDLKPANIKVREDGTVKVLDFGLAKALDPNPTGDPSQSPTLTAAATQMGVIMGTAAYMSPEQARGKPVDKRSDIWSFGCVFYEMLTGQRAFEGEDVSLTLSAVLQREPAWTVLPVAVSPGLNLYLRRCLQKEPRQRVQAAGDLRLAIEGAFDTSIGASDLSFPSRDGGRSGTRASTYIAIAASLIALVLAAVLVRTPALESVPSVARTSINLPDASGLSNTRGALAVSMDGQDIVYATADGSLHHRPLGQSDPVKILLDERASTPFFSPDGQWLGYFSEATSQLKSGLSNTRGALAVSMDGQDIVYATADGSLHHRPLGQSDPVKILLDERASTPFFSPDGQWLGYFSEATSQLKKVSLRQGTATVTLGDASIPTGVSWSSANRILIGQASDGIWHVSGDGGTPEVLIPVEPGEQAFQPSMLPDGDTVLFTLMPAGADSRDDALIVAETLSTAQRKILIEGGSSAQYVATGHLVYMRDNVLHGATFDLDRLTVTGPPVPLGEHIAVSTPVGIAQFGVSQNGWLVYAGPEAIRSDRRFVWVDRSGEETPIDIAAGDYQFHDLSSDNRRVVARVNDPATGNTDIYVFDLERGTRTRITSSAAVDTYPRWTRGEEDIAFWSLRAAGSNLYRVRADGNSDAELLTTPGSLNGILVPAGWSVDGETLVFTAVSAGNVLTVGPDGQTPTSIVPEPTLGLTSLSPDGRWLAYSSNRSGQTEVYVRPFPNTDSNRWQISTDGGIRPRWRHDGGELFYRNLQGMLMSVSVSGASVLSTATPEPMFDLGTYAPLSFDVASDGERFLLMRSGEAGASAPTTQLVAIQNWHRELLERVPVK